MQSEVDMVPRNKQTNRNRKKKLKKIDLNVETLGQPNAHKRREQSFLTSDYNLIKWHANEFVDSAFFLCVRATYEQCNNYKYGMYILIYNGGLTSTFDF